MFARFFHLIYHPRVLLVLGVIVALVLLYDYVPLKTFIIILAVTVTCALLSTLGYYFWKKRKLASADLANLVEDNGDEYYKTPLLKMRTRKRYKHYVSKCKTPLKPFVNQKSAIKLVKQHCMSCHGIWSSVIQQPVKARLCCTLG